MKSLQVRDKVLSSLGILSLFAATVFVFAEAWRIAAVLTALSGTLLWGAVLVTSGRQVGLAIQLRRVSHSVSELGVESDRSPDTSSIANDLSDMEARLTARIREAQDCDLQKKDAEVKRVSAALSRVLQILVVQQAETEKINGRLERLFRRVEDHSDENLAATAELISSTSRTDARFSQQWPELRSDINRIQQRVRSVESMIRDLDRTQFAALQAAMDELHRRTETVERRILADITSERLEGRRHFERAFAPLADNRERLMELEGRLTAANNTLLGAASDVKVHLQEASEDSRNAIENKLDKTVNRLTERIRRISKNETQQVEALLQLLPALRGIDVPLPPSGRWALDAQALMRLLHLVRQSKPKMILELGSGTSTIWLGHLCKDLGIQLVSVDHLGQFRDQTQLAVNAHGLNDCVEVRLAELTDVTLEDGRECRWYDPTVFDDLSNIGMLIVDGPPNSIGDDARYPALPLLASKLSLECFVILDDADRENERATLEQWLAGPGGFQYHNVGWEALGVLRR